MSLISNLQYWVRGLVTCRAYVATRMTGRKRKEMIRRAKYLVSFFKDMN